MVAFTSNPSLSTASTGCDLPPPSAFAEEGHVFLWYLIQDERRRNRKGLSFKRGLYPVNNNIYRSHAFIDFTYLTLYHTTWINIKIDRHTLVYKLQPAG